MDIQEQIQSRLGDYIKSDKFEKTMQGIVEETVNKTLDSLFSYGEIRDSIKNAFKEKISINVDTIQFPHVNQIITDLVREKTMSAFQEPLREKLCKQLEDMFQPAPREIKVQDFIDILREQLKEDNGCSCDYDDAIAIDIEKSDWNSFDLKIWNDGKRETKSSYSGTSKRTPDYHLWIRKDKTIAIIHDMDTRKTFGSNLYNFDSQLFLMYCAGTVFTDIDTVDVDYLETRLTP